MRVEPNGNMAIQYVCHCSSQALVLIADFMASQPPEVNSERIWELFERAAPEGWYVDVYPNGGVIIRCPAHVTALTGGSS